jgi:hypothetical protein
MRSSTDPARTADKEQLQAPLLPMPGITIWMLATSVLLATPDSLGVGQAQNPAFGLLGADQLGRPHRLGRRSASATGGARPRSEARWTELRPDLVRGDG